MEKLKTVELTKLSPDEFLIALPPCGARLDCPKQGRLQYGEVICDLCGRSAPVKQLAAVKPKQVHIWQAEEHGHYVEPEWCSARLFQIESFGAPRARILDPAAGWGKILRAAKTAGYTAIGSDIVDRLDRRELEDVAFQVCDFLKTSPVRSAWSVVCNPPFDHFEAFCRRALTVAIHKVAMLALHRRLPAARWLQTLPLETVYLLTPRPSMPPGSYIAAGNKPCGGSQDFCWLVFNKQMQLGNTPRLRWLHRDHKNSCSTEQE